MWGVSGLFRTFLVAILLLGVLVAVPLLSSGCGSSGGDQTTAAPGTSEQQVTALVDLTSKAIEKDAAATLADIDAGKKPYVDPAYPDLYPFVYDMQLTVIAHPDATIRGQNMKGKPDPNGKLWRDQILQGALDKGSGRMEYDYPGPGGAGLVKKAAFYKLVTGSDGVRYIVCATHNLSP